MTIGAPVLFKRIQVGKIENIELTEAGDVVIDAFVGAPYHVRLTEGTRFWNASGFSIELGGGGASLNVDSLISLLQGGISFDTVGSDTAPVAGRPRLRALSDRDRRPAELLRGRARRAADARRRLRRLGARPAARRAGRVPRHQGRRGRGRCRRRSIDEDGQPPRVTLRATLAIVPQRLGITAPETSDAARAALDLLASQVEPAACAPSSPPPACSPRPSTSSSPRCPTPPPAALDRDAEPNPRAAERALRRLRHRHLGRGRAAARGRACRSRRWCERRRDAARQHQRARHRRARPRGAGEPRRAARRRPQARRRAASRRRRPQLAAILASARELVDQAVQARVVEEVAAVLDGAKTARRQHRQRRQGGARAGRGDRGDVAPGARAAARPARRARRTRLVGNVNSARAAAERRRGVPGLGQRLAGRAARADGGRCAPAARSTTSTPPSPRSARSPTRSPPPTSPPACRPCSPRPRPPPPTSAPPPRTCPR